MKKSLLFVWLVLCGFTECGHGRIPYSQPPESILRCAALAKGNDTASYCPAANVCYVGDTKIRYYVVAYGRGQIFASQGGPEWRAADVSYGGPVGFSYTHTDVNGDGQEDGDRVCVLSGGATQGYFNASLGF